MRKYLQLFHLCSKDEWNTYGFGIIWSYVNNEKCHFCWTLCVNYSTFPQHVLNSQFTDSCWNQRWFYTHCSSLDLCFSDILLWFQPIYWIQALNILHSEAQPQQTLHSELWLLSGGYWFLALFIRNTFTFEFTWLALNVTVKTCRRELTPA